MVEDDDAFDVSYSDYDESVPPEQQYAAQRELEIAVETERWL